MAKRKKNKKKFQFYGSVVKVVLVFTVFCVGKLFLQSTYSRINYQVEKDKKEILVQEKTNESLSMAINELVSLTKIEEVAKKQGLSYNNKNIKVVKQNK